MPNIVNSCVKLFADDTKIYRSVINIADCENLQSDIDSLSQWAQKWQMKFHPNKCKVMRLGNSNPEFTYKMRTEEGDTVALEVSSIEKDLGVHMDNKLAFKDHIAKTVNKANQITGMIRRSFQFMDMDMFKSLFTSRVRPVLECGNTIWCPRHKKDVTAIENVQRRATKMVPGLHNLQYEDRLKKLKLPSLIYRRERGDMIETYKYLTNIYNTENPWLILEADSNTRGHSLKLTKQRSTSYTIVNRKLKCLARNSHLYKTAMWLF